MGIDVKCDRCANALESPGALVFSPPQMAAAEVVKYHLCVSCWKTLREDIWHQAPISQQPVELPLVKRLEEQRDYHYRQEEEAQKLGDTPLYSQSYIEAAKGNAIEEVITILRGIKGESAQDKRPKIYTDLSAPDFLAALGTDGMKWADAFMELWGHRRSEIDHGLMLSWFCNAMMAMYDDFQRTTKREIVEEAQDNSVIGKAITGWQPIETAPKDYQWIFVARFDADNKPMWARATRWEGTFWQYVTVGEGRPSHWLSMPPLTQIEVE